MNTPDYYARIKQGEIVGVELHAGRFTLTFNNHDIQLSSKIGTLTFAYDDLDDLTDLLSEAIEVRGEVEVNKLRKQ
jgi:hypothetical protein